MSASPPTHLCDQKISLKWHNMVAFVCDITENLYFHTPSTLIFHLSPPPTHSVWLKNLWRNSKMRLESYLARLKTYVSISHSIHPSTLICYPSLNSCLCLKNYISTARRGRIRIWHNWKPIFPYLTRPKLLPHPHHFFWKILHIQYYVGWSCVSWLHIFKY